MQAERIEALFQQQGIAHRPPLTVSLITGGQSNLTYEVSDMQQSRWVVRRPPQVTALESAHDVLREYRIVSAVSKSRVPVAPPVFASDDSTLLGAPFALYGFVEGQVLHTQEAASLLPLDERFTLGFSVFDVLADLHLLDPDDIGLGNLGPREGYVERQLRRWSKQWEAQSPRRIAEWEEVRARLSAAPPHAQRVGVVHGDYRLGNLIVAGGTVRAVVDWELCTLGDPLADLAYVTNNWLRPGEKVHWESAPTRAGGFPEREVLLERYAARTQLDLSDLYLYRAFAMWRIASILEGVRMRKLAMGQSDQAADATLSASIEALAKDALELLERR